MVKKSVAFTWRRDKEKERDIIYPFFWSTGGAGRGGVPLIRLFFPRANTVITSVDLGLINVSLGRMARDRDRFIEYRSWPPIFTSLPRFIFKRW